MPNYQSADLGALWTWGRAQPKAAAVASGQASGHTVFLEQVHLVSGRPEPCRRFGSYTDVSTMEAHLGTADHHLFEIVTGAHKPYLDLDSKDPLDLPRLRDLLATLSAGFQEVLGIRVDPDAYAISTAVGAVGAVTKYSYHVTINIGMHCERVGDFKRFLAHVLDPEAYPWTVLPTARTSPSASCTTPSSIRARPPGPSCPSTPAATQLTWSPHSTPARQPSTSHRWRPRRETP